MELAPYAVRLDSNELQMRENVSGANSTFVSFEINHSRASTAHAPSRVHNDLSDTTSIEALLEELSAQQNASWDETEAQCMYNLGFMNVDQSTE